MMVQSCSLQKDSPARVMSHANSASSDIMVCSRSLVASVVTCCVGLVHALLGTGACSCALSGKRFFSTRSAIIG